MNQTIEVRRRNHRWAAYALVLALLVISPGALLASDAQAPTGPAVLDGLQGLWSTLTEAWSDVARLFAGDAATDGTATGTIEPACELDCGETWVDIDPDG